jgi:hypothetical protein
VPVVCAVLVSSAGGRCTACTLLCSGSETAVVPAEDGCCVVLGGGSAVFEAVCAGREGISRDGARISGNGVGVSGARERVR